MKKILCLAAALALACSLALCAAEAIPEDRGEAKALKMNVQIGEYTFTATLEDNSAVSELVEMMRKEPVTIEMDDYAGFEKVGPLGTRLTAQDVRTATRPGDIVLYNASNIVMFYGTNTWAYTRIGRIDDLTDWETALGSGSITAVFSLTEEETPGM